MPGEKRNARVRSHFTPSLLRVTSQLEDSKASPKTDPSAPELATLRSRLAQKDAETIKLVEENERLAEQVASSTERPEAEGQEAGKANGHAEVVVPAGEQVSHLVRNWCWLTLTLSASRTRPSWRSGRTSLTCCTWTMRRCKAATV